MKAKLINLLIYAQCKILVDGCGQTNENDAFVNVNLTPSWDWNC